MNTLSMQELLLTIAAVKHYQTHNLSVKSSQYKEYSHILNVLEQQISDENLSGLSRHQPNQGQV